MSKKRRGGRVPAMKVAKVLPTPIPSEPRKCVGCHQFYKGVERDKDGQVLREFDCRTRCRII